MDREYTPQQFYQKLRKCDRGVQGQVLTLSDLPSNSKLFFCVHSVYVQLSGLLNIYMIFAAQQLKTSAVKSPAQMDFNTSPKSLCSLVRQLSKLYIPCFRTKHQVMSELCLHES